ncbi:hypothetical protein D910_02885 [Dendroctonus ponderosae]|uniref:MICOS complex subunit MIC13 n=1 Tax=Dendroctonus ponderosae TaxID=77166 RepID=U4U4E9_DENPD|nr:hypothetical protein D910_02885 [Dendroctonus ponderosae]
MINFPQALFGPNTLKSYIPILQVYSRGFFRFAIKAGLAASAIYYVREQGVWKNSDETIETGKRLKSAVSPYIEEVKAQIPIELPVVPQTENACQLAKEYWNAGVRATFAFLVKLPDYSCEYTKKGRDKLMENPEIKNFVNSFSSAN